MNNEQAKAEAEKIIQEYYEQIPEAVFETALNYDILHELSKKCAIIHVKGIIKENHFIDNNYDISVKVVDILSRRLEYWQSIR